MSILNRPSDGLFNVLIVLVRCLAAHGPMHREKLLNVCAPPSAVESQERATQTLNRWIQLGLLNEDESGSIDINAAMHNEVRRRGSDTDRLAKIIRSLVLSPENNERFWESENNRSADFTRALCWMLAQNVFAFEVVGHTDVQKREVAQLRSLAAFTNDTRWAGFKSWAVFLGFGWIGRYPTNAFVIDPTPAVRDALPQVFESSRELRQSVFFSRLAQVLPVVDGGEYRTRVEQKIDRSVLSPTESDQVSSSLSRALNRLHECSELILDERADAEKRSLLGRKSHVVRNVSHIVWKGGKS